ncbi:MAG TPA: response regulator [Polyangiaceae bacterium]|nr:response regulator [Polyangiaceae bacterium]
MPLRQPEDLSGLTILLVEENEDARQRLDHSLRAEGARVVTANGVAQALARFQEAPFDVLVSDLNMADGGGYALIQQIRALPDGAGGFVPAIAVSSASDEGTRRTALRAGFWRFVPKPVDPGFLHAEIATVGRAYKQSNGS